MNVQTEEMMALVEVGIALLVAVVLVVTLVFVISVSGVYVMGYIYDAICGDFFVKMGHFVARKYPKIKERSMAIKIWEKIQPKNVYLRYETPLFSYCFSYMGISLITAMLPKENVISFIVASALYLLVYFVGMARRIKSSELYYKKVLDNNMAFLKLSFLPLGFVITIVGFGFTITGMRVQDIPFDFTMIRRLYNQLTICNSGENILFQLLEIVVVGGVLLLLLYVISLPIQVISYLIISIINYFIKYKEGYKELFKVWIKIVISVFKG